ncbi:unnamed protein product [Trichogramma brassicae]|uniref:Nucleic-acid-binding protein from transposon X-element n=1 Tax=Trichogramma brassicae TaxID=86971 RepID=A0A6H5I509_9HYME|nr:unnamed protein product [Trichogramma brassicae]
MQCTKCQKFWHTKYYCFQSPVCVKCAGSHLTRDCSIKTKVTDVRCANCDGNHPASYKRCPYQKELLKKMYLPRGAKQPRAQTVPETTQPSPHASNVSHNNTANAKAAFARVVSAASQGMRLDDQPSADTQITDAKIRSRLAPILGQTSEAAKETARASAVIILQKATGCGKNTQPASSRGHIKFTVALAQTKRVQQQQTVYKPRLRESRGSFPVFGSRRSHRRPSVRYSRTTLLLASKFAVYLQASPLLGSDQIKSVRVSYSKRARARPAPTTEITLADQPRSLSPTSRGHSRQPAETAPLRGHPPTHSPLNERRRRR